MSFTDSLSQFSYLSELYAQDCPDAALMTEYPSSNSTETRFQNRTRYIIHDPFPPPPVALLKTLGPHHLMFGWGNKLPVVSEVEPPQSLLDHWQRHFGPEGSPTWQSYREDRRYITSFPFETIAAAYQVINPDRLYHLHSKEALADIECPQAAVYDEIQYPCVLKLSHGYAGLGNFMIDTPDQLEAARAQLAADWPDAPLVINQKLENIIGDYGVQFYLSGSGEMTWLGHTEQLFNDTGRWHGGVFKHADQDALYAQLQPIAQKVANYLAAQGYFGVVGIDILKNAQGDYFLVDLNPRLTGITPFLMIARQLCQQGLGFGQYAASVAITGSLDDVIARAEDIQTAKSFILSGYQPAGSPDTICHIGVYGTDQPACAAALTQLTD